MAQRYRLLAMETLHGQDQYTRERRAIFRRDVGLPVGAHGALPSVQSLLPFGAAVLTEHRQ